jgi:hypothetical protein
MINVALVETKATISFTHKRRSRCRRTRKVVCQPGLLPRLEIFNVVQLSRCRVAHT